MTSESSVSVTDSDSDSSAAKAENEPNGRAVSKTAAVDKAKMKFRFFI
jgi:hypothetical protein